MENQKTIYAVVRLDKELCQFGCHIYSKQSSNLEKMREYAKEIIGKYPECKVILVSREKANIIYNKHYEYYNKMMDRKALKIMGRIL